MNRDQMIEDLQRIAKLLGRGTFSRSEFKRYGRVSSGLVERTFGTWNKAMQAAGLSPIDTYKRIADNELEEESSAEFRWNLARRQRGTNSR